MFYWTVLHTIMNIFPFGRAMRLNHLSFCVGQIPLGSCPDELSGRLTVMTAKRHDRKHARVPIVNNIPKQHHKLAKQKETGGLAYMINAERERPQSWQPFFLVFC